MKTEISLFSRIIIALAGIAVVFGLSACGSDGSDSGDFDDEASQSCVAELNQQDIQDASVKLQQAEQAGLQDPSVGVDSVCTINPQTGDIHYYNRNDGFRNYLLYAAFTGRASSFGAMYALSGGDPFDAMLMDHFIGVNRYGNAFYPYSNVGNGYNRTPQPITNVNVTNVYYGSGPRAVKKSYSDSLSSAPTNYRTTTIKRSSDVDGEAPLSNGGRPVSKVTPIPGKSGHTDFGSAPVKKVAPGATVANPAKKGSTGAPAAPPKSGSSSGSGSGGSNSSPPKSGSGSGSGSKSSPPKSGGSSGGGSKSGKH